MEVPVQREIHDNVALIADAADSFADMFPELQPEGQVRKLAEEMAEVAMAWGSCKENLNSQNDVKSELLDVIYVACVALSLLSDKGDSIDGIVDEIVRKNKLKSRETHEVRNGALYRKAPK